MKKTISLLLALVLCLSLCACGDTASEKNEVPESTTPASAGLWSAEKMVDEFGDVIEGSMAIVQTPISGDFSNTATSSSKLTGYVFMYMTDGYPTFLIRLLEYGDHQATYTSYDNLVFKVKIGDSIIEFHPVLGNPPNGDLMVYDSTETLYTALYNGTDVRCIAQIGNSKYNFTLYADNFANICDETGYITQALYFSKTDNETLYNNAKQYIEEKNYGKAITYLEYLGDYADCKDLLLEVVCNGYYYNESSDDYIDVKNAWKQFFNAETATPLTDEEIKEIIIGDWRSHDGDTYSTYTENGEYHYFMGGTESNSNIANNWWVENGRLVIESKYTRSEYVIFHFYKNVYVFCAPRAYNKVTSDVYELHFLNGPLA